MRASSLNKSSLFKVRKYIAQHTCSVRERVYARRQGITDVVAVLIMEKYIDPSKVYTPKDIADDMLKLHGVSLTYIQAWRAKEKAVKLVRGDPAEYYARLPEACIRGWEYCRPIVVVDGAALKWSYGGTMLTASTLDLRGHILPLAYAIVDSENDASWTWFFEQFREAYGVRQNMCFMSDRNESIWKGTANVYPESEHYACIWHLSVNVLKNFNRNTEDLKILFFSLAKAYTKQKFETIMGRIDQIDTRI
ncbi:PKS-NRPS hybrid synthetase cheA-like [Solanum lycopersicum]|uniref:PKS-NRPS hybrid synthetase cheA-like n=1 Tax=Solanum lycopersicum TaxID=4081 RepID=UPI0002BC7D8C